MTDYLIAVDLREIDVDIDLTFINYFVNTAVWTFVCHLSHAILSSVRKFE